MGYQLQQHAFSAAPSPAEHDLVQVDDLVQLGRLLWRRKWRILLGASLGVLIGILYCTLSPPIYESSAQVLVMKRQPAGRSTAAGHYYFEDDLTTHVSLIKSPWFIREMVAKHQFQSLPSLAEQPDPTRAVIAALSVVPENEQETEQPSSILKLSFRGLAPQDCVQVVNAVMERYQEFLNEASRNVNEDAFRLITEKAEKTRQELEKKEVVYQEFRKRAPLVWNESDRARRNQDRLADTESKQSELLVRRAELQSRIAALRAAGNEPDRAALTANAPGAPYRETAAMQAERMLGERLLPLLLQEKTLRKDYGPGHPDVRSVREQIDLTRQFFTPSSAGRESLLDQSDQNRRTDLVESYIRSLEQEAKDIEASQQVLDAQWKREQDEAKRLTEYEILDRQHTEEMARITRYYESLLEQLQGIGLNKDLVGYRMRVIAPATTPVQVAPRVVLVLSLTILLGLVGGLGWGWASEARDKSLRTPEEIRQRLGLPVFGCIPRLAQRRVASTPRIPHDAMLDSVLCAHYRPDSAEAEAYREVRTALCFSILGKKDRVIQITSPNVGDGKTTLASNLAVSLARSGQRVLLVDADLRRPRIHELFGRSSQIGLTSVVRGDAGLEEAVQPSGIPGLWLLPSGPLPVDPADLLTTQHFQEVLDAVRQQYDFVLIDSSALLVATDARVVAARADAVLLTVRFAKNGRPQLQRAREILEQLEANLLGAVVNASSQHAGFAASALGDREPANARFSNNGRDSEVDPPREPAD